MGRTHLCSSPVGTFEKGGWGGHLGEGGVFLGEVQRQVGETARGFLGEGWHQGLGQGGTVTLERTRPGRWSRTCSRVAAMSISFTPGDKGHRAAQGVSRGGSDPGGPGCPGVGGLHWAKPGAGPRALWARPSPFAMRFSTMSMRM